MKILFVRKKGPGVFLALFLILALFSLLPAVPVLSQEIVVSTETELHEALDHRYPIISLGADIEVNEVILVHYDCTITSLSEARLYRSPDYTSVLLSLEMFEDEDPISMTLDGIVVDGMKIQAQEPALFVGENTTLHLRNTTIRDNYNDGTGSEDGGGICNRGTLNLYDGTSITGNRAVRGGGVMNPEPHGEKIYDDSHPLHLHDIYVPYRNVFNMYGGEITCNEASFSQANSSEGAGGGVFVETASYQTHYNPAHYRVFIYAIFNLFGGKISNNSTEADGHGGGVSLGWGYQAVTDENWLGEIHICFTMEGGEISNNYAGGSGGGVWTSHSAFVMEGGAITRNFAEDSGGGIAGGIYAAEAKVFKMTGGEISLNAAREGGGIGPTISGFFLAGTICDNLAYERADDFEIRTLHLTLMNRMPGRAYGTDFKTDEPLFEEMEELIGEALPVITAELIPGAPAPDGVTIPFFGWFEDGGDSRFETIAGDRFPREPETLHWDAVEVPQHESLKALWHGLLLLYDANFEGGPYLYDPHAYLPQDQAAAAANTFTRQGYRFTGWNTEAGGKGTECSPGQSLPMDQSQVLYAQWEKLPVGSLTVSMTVSGGGADESQPFDFIVTLDDPALNGKYGDMDFLMGQAHFQLKHGQSMAASNLPAGTGYTVEQALVTGYSTRFDGREVNEKSGDIGQGLTVILLADNYKATASPSGPVDPGIDLIPATGIKIFPLAAGAVFILLALLSLVPVIRRIRREP